MLKGTSSRHTASSNARATGSSGSPLLLSSIPFCRCEFSSSQCSQKSRAGSPTRRLF
jgi:hypothetical protein